RSGRQGEAGGRGVRSLPFRPPSPLMKSVRLPAGRQGYFQIHTAYYFLNLNFTNPSWTLELLSPKRRFFDRMGEHEIFIK
ncbi:hypothetical protein COX73_02805, partial [bacterium (Candidatus Gribaldobacteria) CG_4_10_14_0_2_um_filter_36_18]